MTETNSKSCGNEGSARRRRVLSALAQMEAMQGGAIMSYAPDGSRQTVGTLHECDVDGGGWEWVSIWKEMDVCNVELCIDRECRHYEIGIPRVAIGGTESLDEALQRRLSDLNPETWKSLEKDRYWHLVHRGEIPSECPDEECVELLTEKLMSLLKVCCGS